MTLIFDWFEAGQINPVSGGVLPLERFQDAMAEVLGRRAQGRISIVMNEEAQ